MNHTKSKLLLLSLLNLISVSSNSQNNPRASSDEPPLKKQKIENLSWKIDFSYSEFVIVSSNGNILKYTYNQGKNKFIKKDWLNYSEKVFLNNQKDIHDPTGKWNCICLPYKFYLDPTRYRNTYEIVYEYVLISPSTGCYVTLSEKPGIDSNGYLIIDPFTFIPQFNETKGYNDWTIERTQASNNCFLEKSKNKFNDEKIFSLFRVDEKGTNSINISEFIKRDYNINIINVDQKIYLAKINNNSYLLITAFEKNTHKPLYFGIKIDNIHNKKHLTSPFEKMDFFELINHFSPHQLIENKEISISPNNNYSNLWGYAEIPVLDPQEKEKNIYILFNEKENRFVQTPFVKKDVEFPYSEQLVVSPDLVVPPLDIKKTNSWHIVSEFYLNTGKKLLMDEEKNRFFMRVAQRKLADNTLDKPIYSLHLINKDGHELGHLNLSHYLERDFDEVLNSNSILENKLSNPKILEDGKFITFSMLDRQWAIEVSDLKNKKNNYKEKGNIYSPIMLLDNVIQPKKNYIFADFLTINPTRTTFNNNANDILSVFFSKLSTNEEHINRSNEIKRSNQMYQDFVLNDAKHIPIFLTLEKKTNSIYKARLTLFARDQLRCRDINSFDITVNSKENNLLSVAPKVSMVAPNRKIWNVSTPTFFNDLVSEFESSWLNTNYDFPKNLIFNESINNECYIAQRDALFFLGSLAKKEFKLLSEAEKKVIEKVFSEEFVKEFNRQGLSLYNFISNYLVNCEMFGDLYSREFINILNKKTTSSFGNKEGITPIYTLETILRRFIGQNYIFVDLKNKELIL